KESSVATTNGAGSAAASVDWEQALEGLDGDRSLLVELIGIFQEECPKLCGEMEKAIESGDLPSIRRTAHTLRGALNHLAAAEAVALAQQMEEAARGQDLAGALAIWPRLGVELDRLAPALAEYAKQPS